ncbi:MAG: MATE family efflux transporter [Clostridia bacterium]|nr:MATE family efflux transporter [Clostridia bacterium]
MASLRKDFTQGNITKSLIMFAIPFLAANLLQALYGVADVWFVSRYCGAESVSGVNIGSQITHLLTMAVSGLTVGGTILVAQFFAARKENDVSETIGTMFSLLFILAVALSVAVIMFVGPILRLLNTPAEAMEEARAYTNICMLGMVFVFGYNAVSAVQRGMGDSKRPLVFVAVACTVNIFVDWLFVGKMHMGAAGAAWATILAQAISFVSAVVYLGRKGFVFDFRLSSFRIRKDKVRLLVKLGVPASLQSIAVNTSFLIMNAIVNSFGVNASAAVGLCGKFNSFAILPTVAMQQSVSAVAAQNISAKMYDRANKTLSAGLAISLLFGVSAFVLSQFFPEQILHIFTDDTAVVSYGVLYLMAFSYDYLAVPFQFCLAGLLNGSGNTQISMFGSILSSIIARMPLAIFLSRTALGLAGVGYAAPAATLVGAAVLSCFYFSGRWKQNRTGIERE